MTDASVQIGPSFIFVLICRTRTLTRHIFAISVSRFRRQSLYSDTYQSSSIQEANLLRLAVPSSSRVYIIFNVNYVATITTAITMQRITCYCCPMQFLMNCVQFVSPLCVWSLTCSRGIQPKQKSNERPKKTTTLWGSSCVYL